MSALIPIFLMGICIKPMIINQSPYPLEEIDFKTLAQNENFCKDKFKEAVCIKKFIKRDKQVYRIICGKPEVR